MLLINVTEFFRDRDAFLFLRNTVLPELVERGRTRGRQLRFWSAGCSTGEEAYSLVIGLAELLGSELAQWNIRVFATDVDEDAVAYARRGLYPENVLGALSDGRRTVTVARPWRRAFFTLTASPREIKAIFPS